MEGEEQKVQAVQAVQAGPMTWCTDGFLTLLRSLLRLQLECSRDLDGDQRCRLGASESEIFAAHRARQPVCDGDLTP